MSKLFILAIAGLAVAVFIYFRNRRNVSRGTALALKLKTDPSKSKDIIEDLISMVGSLPIVNNEQIIRSKVLSFIENKELSNYSILHAQELDNQSWLFITLCTDNDYDITLTGKMGSVKKQHQFNFLLKQDLNENKLKIFSNIQETLYEKNLQSAFAHKFLDFLNC